MTVNPYQDPVAVRELAEALRAAADGLPDIRIMHVCGTHEHELGRHALRQLFPSNVRLIAGPGCPVCITPASVIATTIALALHPDHPILCTYGDMVRVPITGGSLLDSRGEGADVRIVYSIRDAIRIAADTPERTVVFFSVGFETTAAPVAAALAGPLPDNFLIYCCHRYVPPAVEALAAGDDGSIDGFLLPGHACVITGTEPYRFLPERYGRAAAVSGFEPVDILTAVLSIVRQIRRGEPTVANCYSRIVRDAGNPHAQELLDRVFRPGDGAWRGIGILPGTSLVLRDNFNEREALIHFGITERPAQDIMPGCICHLVLTGQREPESCGLFGRVCTPTDPQGPCMVSAEGTCRARFLYPEAPRA